MGRSVTFSVTGQFDEDEFERVGLWDASKVTPFAFPECIVADVGAGAGRVATYIAPVVGRIWIIDFSRSMLRQAKRRLALHTNVSFVRADVLDMEFVPADSFDIVYSFRCLQHLEKEDAWLAFQEIRRITKPGGRIYLQFPTLKSDEVWGWFLRYVQDPCTRSKARVRTFTEDELRVWVARADLVLERLSVDGCYLELLLRKPETRHHAQG